MNRICKVEMFRKIQEMLVIHKKEQEVPMRKEELVHKKEGQNRKMVRICKMGPEVFHKKLQ